MHRMILWKEWREQRLLVLTALGLSVLMPLLMLMIASGDSARRGVDLRDVADLLPVLLLGFAWPCFLLAAGANTIANETGEGTLGFLLSRPIPRARLWSAKVLMAAGSGLIVLIGNVAICWVMSLVAGQPLLSLQMLYEDRPFASFAGFVLPGLVIGVGVSCLLFSMAILCSTLISRTLTAAAAALAASLVLIAWMVFLWSRLDLVPRLEPEWLSLQLLLSGLVILGGSLWLFSRGELLLSRGRRAAACAAVALVGLPAAGLPSVLALTRLTPAEAVLAELALPASASEVIATATREDGGSPQIWSIAADGSGTTRLTGRLAMSPAVSPDGRFLAYVSGRGPLGLRSSSAELRIARTDGGHDWAVADGLGLQIWTTAVFSSAGERIAAMQNNRLIVASTDGAVALGCDLGPDSGPPAWLLGFTPEGAEALLLRADLKGSGPARLMAVTPGSCGERLIHDFGAAADPAGLIRPAKSGRYLTLVTQAGPKTSRSRSLHLIDLESGAHHVLTTSACRAPADFSRDEKTLVYAECLPGGGPPRSVIHRVQLPHHSDKVLAEIPGRAWSVFLSPSGDRVAVRQQGGDRRVADLVIEENGRIIDLDVLWEVLGWNGDNRLVLADAPVDDYRRRRLAMAGGGSWKPQEFYPEHTPSY